MLDDRGVEAGRGGDHARVVLRERDDEQSFTFEFLGGLAEPPRVVDEFADVVLGGERPNMIDGLEHRMNSTGEGRVFASDRQVRTQAERAGNRWTGQGHRRLTLHDARHSYASLMIAAGVNAKALSTFMGHANIAITMDLYGHLLPGSEAEAATLFDAYLAREVGGSTSTETSTDPAHTTA